MCGRVAAARLAVEQAPSERNIAMTMNWLEGLNHGMAEAGRPMAMPVFAGQKLVVVGGSSGMGRQTAADVVAAGGSAVIIGEDAGKVEDTAILQVIADDLRKQRSMRFCRVGARAEVGQCQANLRLAKPRGNADPVLRPDGTAAQKNGRAEQQLSQTSRRFQQVPPSVTEISGLSV